uniref:Cyclin N-terminal domain-containing protein n=1 Tax=Oryza rufipogon TaxID=4529 RepID=A0A0E0NR64_ORYRU
MGDASASTSAPATPTSTLICREDGNDLFSADPADDDGGGDWELSIADDDHVLLMDRDDEYLALMLSKERCAGGGGGGERGDEEEEMVEEWMKNARAWCVGWIVKRDKEWALQLLSVACLSLAAKVEERRPPRLPEFKLDMYDCASLMRMELLVLTTLKWQMITETPFSYLNCFTAKFRHDERKAIVLRAIECIFASIKGRSFPPSAFISPNRIARISFHFRNLVVISSVGYQPSTIALAAILIARNKETAPNLDELKSVVGSLWQQLDTGHVYSCYNKMMIQEDRSMQSTTEVASSGVSVAHIGGSEDSAMGGANNATTLEATPDKKRKRLHSPQRQ